MSPGPGGQMVGALAGPRFARGLVVGKFAPLHRGHQHLLDAASAACGELLVLSYCRPELPGYPSALRERWLRELYPRAQVLVLDEARLAQAGAAGEPPRASGPPAIPRPVRVPAESEPEEAHRRFCAEVCLALGGGPVDAVFTSERYGDGLAATMTSVFRRCLDAPACGPVTHLCVDQARRTVPISGRALRADPHGLRRWLPPAVYASFVRRVVLLGAESTGKTTLASAAARALGTSWVPEYGRQRWEERGGQLAFEDLLAIGRRQVQLEEQALRAPVERWLLCDTSPLTTLWYSQALFGRADPALEALAARPYDCTLLCGPDFALVQDGTRQDEAFRQRQQRWYRAQLGRRGVRYHELAGPCATRLGRLRALLEGDVAQTIPR